MQGIGGRFRERMNQIYAHATSARRVELAEHSHDHSRVCGAAPGGVSGARNGARLRGVSARRQNGEIPGPADNESAGAYGPVRLADDAACRRRLCQTGAG